MIGGLFLAVALAFATPGLAQQQGWSNLDQLLITSLLSPQASLEASWWLPDHVEPSRARTAIGITYFSVPGGGNSIRIASGYFIFTDSGWNLATPLSGLFGNSPRDVVFFPDRIELTTTMPKLGDPRCCPSGEGRWSVDRATGTVARLQ